MTTSRARPLGLRLLVNGLIAVAVVLGGVGYGAAATSSVVEPPRPKTLLTVPGRIVAFAQDETHIVWANGGAACGRVVQLKSLATGAASFLDTPGGPLCEELEYSFLDTITLAGTRALWVTAHESLSSVYFTLFTAVPDGRRERKLGDLSLESDNPLLAPVPMAGDGSTLLFARRSSSSDDSFARSGVYRVREQARYVAGTEGVLDIAADGSRFALARRIAGGCVCNHSPFWSPDGKHIAFVSARAEGRRNQVFAMDADGARLQPLMDGGYFQWAPDGSALAGYSSDLAVVRPDGSDRRTLYRGHGGLFAWSPDARQLAFTDGNGLPLHVVSATGGPPVNLGVQGDSPVWSPDSRSLAYVRFVGEVEADRKAHVFVIPASGGAERDLGPGGAPRWSPDSRRVAYAREVAGARVINHVVVVSLSGSPAVDLGVAAFAGWSPDGTAMALSRADGVYVAAADGSAVRQIAPTECSNCLAHTEWSPDGRWIAFADGALSVVRPEGGTPRRLAPNVPYQYLWSPTSRAIAFGSGQGSMTVVDVDSGAARQIPGGPWLSWSPDGQQFLYVFEIAARSGRQSEVAVADTTSGNSTVLTRTDAVPTRMVVEIRTRAGKRITSFDASVDLIGLAFSGSRVGLVLDKAGPRPEPVRATPTTIEIRTTAGRLLRKAVVPRPLWGQLTMSGRWAAFVTWPTSSRSDKRAIRLLDVQSGRTAILAQAETVVGLSIERNRVAWAEHDPTTSRIRAVTLPGS